MSRTLQGPSETRLPIDRHGFKRPGRLIVCWAALVSLSVWPSLGLAAVPVASDATYTVEPGSAVTITLAATDGDSDPLDYIITTSLPTSGDVTVGGVTLTSDDLPYTIPGNGKVITFTADSDTHGNATINFKANDGSNDSNAATAAVTINLAPTAAETTTFFTEPDTDLQFDLPAEDPDEDTLSFTMTSLPGHGSLKIGSTTLADTDIPYDTDSASVTFIPDDDYHGQDWLTFTASDGNASSASITTTIEVNTTPVPEAQIYTVVPGGSVTIVLEAEDADKDQVGFVIASLPDHATLTIGGQAITEEDLPLSMTTGVDTVVYQVDANYISTDTFHYRAADAVSTSGRAVVTIYVNTPAVAPDLNFAVMPNSTVTDVLTPTDADGDTLTIRITKLGTHGTLKLDDKTVSTTDTEYAVPSGGLSFTYELDADFEGEDSFTWVANDGLEDSSAGEVMIFVLAVSASTPDTPPTTDYGLDETTTWGQTTDGQDDGEVSDTPESEEAPPACGPIAGSMVLMSAVWALVITPRPRRRRRFFDSRSH